MAPANRKILNSDINVGRQALCPGGGALLQRYCLPSSSIRTMRAGSAKYLSSISRISIRGGRARENLISRCGLGALDKYFPLAEEESPLSLLRPSFSLSLFIRPPMWYPQRRLSAAEDGISNGHVRGNERDQHRHQRGPENRGKRKEGRSTMDSTVDQIM